MSTSIPPPNKKDTARIDPANIDPGKIDVAVRRLAHGEGLHLPAYETAGSAGMDLRAAIDAQQTIRLAPMARCLVPTGLAFEIPQGFEGQVRPRSGLAIKHGITCLNTPGTIDSDYRGEVQVILINLGQEEFVIERGMRIAQIVFAATTQATIVVKTAIGSTDRGSGGFGSTDIR